MKIVGVISDTHGLLRPEALEVLEGVDLIVHAGDIGSPEIIDALRELAPVFAIRGNVDRGIWADEFSATEIVEVDDLLALRPARPRTVGPRSGGGRLPRRDLWPLARSEGRRATGRGLSQSRQRGAASLATADFDGPHGCRRCWAGENADVLARQSFVFGSGAKRIEVELISLEEAGRRKTGTTT